MRKTEPISEHIEKIESRLRSFVSESELPGVALGILSGEERFVLVDGVTNLREGSAFTQDTLFRIGSITKVYTATLIMILVDQGWLSLDEPVTSYIPGFRTAESTASSRITVRHLLNHSSGIDGGDYLADFGTRPDRIERYVASCKRLGQLYPPGLLPSYSNAGFVILGRAIELVTGLSFDEAIERYLLDPLGLERTTTTTERTPRHSVAVGHVPSRSRQTGQATLDITPFWSYPTATGPAGATLVTSIPELLEFLRLHAEMGQRQLLSADALLVMQTPQFSDWPNLGGFFENSNLGMPWRLSVWDGHHALTHAGGSPGGWAFAALIPELTVGLVAYGNGPRAAGAVSGMMTLVFEEVLGIHAPPPFTSSVDPREVEIDCFVGTYECLGQRVVISEASGKLTFTTHSAGFHNGVMLVDEPLRAGPTVELDVANESTLVAAAPRTFLRFLDPDQDGAFAFVEIWRRLHRRAA